MSLPPLPFSLTSVPPRFLADRVLQTSWSEESSSSARAGLPIDNVELLVVPSLSWFWSSQEPKRMYVEFNVRS